MQRDADTLRLRRLAAAAILLAGITLGFTFGRVSVWLVDAPNTDMTARPASERGANTAVRTTPPVPVSEPRPSATAPATQLGRTPAANPSGPMPSPPLALTPDTSPPPQPTPPATTAASQEPPKPVVAPNWRAASGEAGSNGKVEDKPPGLNVQLINPGQDNAPRVATEPARAADPNQLESETDRQDIAACEKRYSSFRRSDGTYQPYGGGARQRCPLLR
jgi:BA14K-like protein